MFSLRQPRIPEYTSPMPLEKWYTVKEVAARLGISERRVHKLLKDELLIGERVGWAWMVHEDKLGEFEKTRNRNAGRPKGK